MTFLNPKQVLAFPLFRTLWWLPIPLRKFLKTHPNLPNSSASVQVCSDGPFTPAFLVPIVSLHFFCVICGLFTQTLPGCASMPRMGCVLLVLVSVFLPKYKLRGTDFCLFHSRVHLSI